MLGWFAETTVVAGLLALVAASVSRWGGLGSATRHALWLVVLLKMVTPPLANWPVGPLRWAAATPARVAVIVGATEPEPGPASPIEANGPRDHEPLDPAVLFAEAEPGVQVEDTPGAAPTIPQSSADDPAPVAAATGPGPPASGRAVPWTLLIPLGWGLGAAGYAAHMTSRILRMHRRLRRARSAPSWLVDMVASEAARFGLRPPRVVLVDGLGTPYLWCAGRSELVVPRGLVEGLARDRWPGIVAHEVAHLRRLDPWTCRLALVAGLAWWWNPLYWLVRGRLAIEAELACDAMVAAAAPEGRVAFASALVDVCEWMSSSAPAPALGIGGEGPFLERRLTMILNGRDSGRLPKQAMIAVGLTLLLAVPSWSRAQDDPAPPPPPADAPRPPQAPAEPRPPADVAPPAAPVTPREEDEGRHEGHRDDDEDVARPRSADVRPGGDRPNPERLERLRTHLRELAEQERRLGEARAQLEAQFGRLRSERRELEAMMARDLRPGAEGREGRPPAPPRERGPRAEPRRPGIPPLAELPAPPRARGAQDREVDTLNRRMDSMEKKLDLLLKELQKSKSADEEAGDDDGDDADGKGDDDREMGDDDDSEESAA